MVAVVFSIASSQQGSHGSHIFVEFHRGTAQPGMALLAIGEPAICALFGMGNAGGYSYVAIVRLDP